MAFCEQCGAQILSKNPSPRSFSCIIRMPDGFYNHLAYFFVSFCYGGRGMPFSARAPPEFFGLFKETQNSGGYYVSI